MTATDDRIYVTPLSLDEQVMAARDRAAEFDLPPGWLLFRHQGQHDGVRSAYWTASRGARPPIWPWQWLRCGLRSTASGTTAREVYAAAWRQEWLLAVWAVTAATARARPRPPLTPGADRHRVTPIPTEGNPR